MQVYAPTTSYSEEDINSFYNDIDETLGKPNHYRMGDFNAQIGKRTNPMETATGKFGLELRNELVEWATSIKHKIRNIVFQRKAGRRWAWKTPNGVTKPEIDYILTNRPDIVTDVTLINQVNIGSDHRLVMSNNKLDVEVERKTIDVQWATKYRCRSNRIKEDQIPTRIEKPIRDTTRSRRHRYHERNHQRHDPTMCVKSC